MQKARAQYPEQPMTWYALSFSYFFGLLANDHFYHALFLLVLFYLIVKSKKYVFYAITIICFAFGFTHGEKPNIPEPPTWFEINAPEEYTAHIDNIRSLPDKRLRIIASSVTNSEGKTLSEKTVIYLYYDRVENIDFESMPLVGMDISFKARIRPVSFSTNPGIAPAEQFWYDQNIFYSAYVTMPNDDLQTLGEGSLLARARNNLYLNYISKCMNEESEIVPSKALLLGIVFGERFFLTTETMNIFTNTSLVHTLALSGMHLGFVGLCAFVLTKLLILLKPKILYKIPFSILLGIFSIPLTFGYLWLGNMPISLIRASCMLIIFWIALIMYKRLSLLDNLLLTASLILLIMPRAWANISFQLSFLAVLSIALSAPLFVYFRKHIHQKYKGKTIPISAKVALFFLALLWTSFTIQIFLYPIQAYTFGLVSPYFALNVIWIPLIEFFILPLAFLALFALEIPLLPDIFISFASFIAQIFISFLNFLHSHFNLLSIQAYRFDLWQGLGFYLLIFSILYKTRLQESAIIWALLSLCLMLYAPMYQMYDNYIAKKEERITLTLLDVGLGQSVVIEWVGKTGAKKALIDAGGVYGNRFDPGRDTVAKVLTYQKFPHIDYVFASHFDSDHAKGLFHIVEHFRIDNFLYSSFSKEENMRLELLANVKEKEITQTTLQAGDTIILEPDIFWLEVLFPPAGGNFSSNNSSLVLRLVHRGEGIALICGDSEESAISRLLEREKNLNAKLLILPHHGSDNSYNEEFYSLVAPKYVTASASKYNRFNFPDPQIISYFKESGIEVLSTGDQGAIEYNFIREK